MMLRRNPHQHPLIYMRGMKSSDLASILDFIYFGEIEMSQVYFKTSSLEPLLTILVFFRTNCQTFLRLPKS